MEEVMRGKSIAEVFPHLKLEGAMQEYLSPARVEHVAIDRKTHRLHVQLASSRWIHKKYIYRLEDEIGRQLFSDTDIRVRIKEQFFLSGQYTPERFYEDYRSSMLQECREQDRLLCHVLQTASVSFPQPDVLEVSLEDTLTGHEKQKELFLYLTQIFEDRCHLPVRVVIKWQPLKKNIHKEEEEAGFREEARRIFAGSGHGEEEQAGSSAESIEVPWDTGTDRGAEAAPAAGKTKKTKAKGSRKEQAASFDSRQDPDLLYGRNFDGDSTPIAELDETSGDVILRGQITAQETRELKSGKHLLLFAITDFTDTIRGKIFADPEQAEPLKKGLKTGAFVRVRGRAMLDAYEHELIISGIQGIRKSRDFRETRMDTWPVKRVELHAHTKMSEMDGVSDVKDLIRRAWKWGHPAIAVTDHGGVQAFPDANKAMQGIDKEYREAYGKEHPDASKEELKKVSAPFKVLYGCEVYLVDDLRGIAVNTKGQTLQDSFVVFDIETTGLSNLTCRIIEIGAVRVRNGEIADRFSTFVNPEVPIPFRIEQLTGISDSMVEDAPTIREVLPEFLAFCGKDVLVAHNADFDVGFIQKACEDQGIPHDFTRIDTVALAQYLLPQLSRFKLETVAKAVQVPLGHHHRAVDDAACTAEIFVRFVQMLEDRGISTLEEMNTQGAMDTNAVRKLRAHHAVLLAQNETGRVNLYRLVSASHLQYIQNKPKLPKSLVNRYREGILVGSGCSEGEVFQGLLSGIAEEELARLVSFYDYLEIQPPENDRHLIEEENEEAIQSLEDLQEIGRRIVKLGGQFQKPVAATGDVHYMDPEDVEYRRIIMRGKKRKDLDEHDGLACFFRTTEEMLEAFSYLGEDKAREVVLETPRRIADSIEKISPIRAGKFPPVIQDSDKQLREICERRAHEIYGPELPDIVAKRLERELTSIISNGYAVMYIIAQKLVWKCNEDGYLVGSRGSVGSSFVATMSGITEVNPLAPHYLCGKCYYVDFDSDTVRQAVKEGRVGCDLPDRVCPVCGEPLQKLGFNIPFETFLGFKGNKEPDIDLNFSGEYQTKAHKYTEVIFGDGQTFRAGTIGTMADKTAYGFVKNYYEEQNSYKRSCEIDRIVQGCVGIRRTTGQHPGGIIVLPIGEDINAFTPVQHPADDPESDIISTHFDYHSIDANLLKLDILGHDDPTMIRMLEDLTGTDATKVRLDEPKVMTLFKDTSALGITPDDIDGCPLGCLGVPEFGTDFVIQMLLDTKPKSFSDLIRISGLSHGTDVWIGNAKTLIDENKCTISTAICTRDDIMAYLIGCGLESEQSFTIMESVRKGKGLKPEWESEMRAHDVPDWYIWSCKRIKYMFPKAHAVAYVMMAYRIAWYKIYYPLAYYAAYFSIRASAFSYEKMCLGRNQLEAYLREYRSRKDSLTSQEKETIKDMKIVQEMYARGFSFVPIDLYRVDAHRFQIVDGGLMPSLDAIEGLGDKAADSIVIAAREGQFLSKDDFRRRAKAGRTITDTLDRFGILKGIPESDQISLFDIT